MPLSNPTVRLRRVQRLPQMMLFLAFVAWYFAAVALATSAANGLGFRFRLVASRGLVEACFEIFLLVLGFAVLAGAARQSVSLRELTALPKRSTAGREWLTGAALGWGLVVMATLPLILSLRLHTRVSFGVMEFRDVVLALATLAVATLAHEMTFRGYPFRCLTRAVGTSFAVFLVFLGAGVAAWYHAWMPGTGVLASMLLTTLLSLSWLRSYGVWLAWGVHFAVAACVYVVFGLPVGGRIIFSTMFRSRAYGADWVTGGAAGPLGSLFGLVVLCVGIAVLYRVTRDYAWNYTHVPIVAGGDVVSVAAPAAHVAMEQKVATAPALVQILATTPNSFSAEAAVIAPGAAETQS